MVKRVVCESFWKVPPGELRDRKGGSRGDEGKIKWKLSEVSRRQNESIDKFKMKAGDVISSRGQVMEYTYISTGIKRELVRFGVKLDYKLQSWSKTLFTLYPALFKDTVKINVLLHADDEIRTF